MRSTRTHPSSRPLVFLGVLIALWVGGRAPAVAGSGRWTPVGPGKGRYVHSIVSVVPDPAEPGAVWAGLPLGGLYRSTDHGTTWRWAGRPFAGNGLRAVAADPTAAGALWAAMPTGLFHTADRGAHWSLISSGAYIAALHGFDPVELAAVPGRPAAFYVRTLRQVLASADGGQSWQTVFDSGDDDTLVDLAIVPASPPALYVGTQGQAGWGLSASLDGGRSWTALTSCPALATGIERLAVSSGAIYVLPVEEERFGLLRSRDGGGTWQSVLGNQPGTPFLLLDVAVDPASPSTVWAVGGPLEGDVTLWVSRDGGSVWRRRSAPPFLPRLAVGPDAVYVFDGVWVARSLDGGWTWSLVLGLPADESPPSRLSFQKGDPSRLTFAVGHRMFRSEDGGPSWSLLTTPSGMNDLWVDLARPGRMVAVGLGVAITADGGRSWKRSASGLYAELLVSAGGRTLFAGGCGVERSRNAGSTWQQVLPCSPRRFPGSAQVVQKLEVDPTHPQVVYALAFLDRDFYPNHGPLTQLPSLLWRSRDGGNTWREIANELDAFTLDWNRSRLYASRGLDLYASDDGGDTWRALPQMPSPVTDLAIPSGPPDTLYGAAASPALRRSLDGGRTWETFDQGIPPGDYLLTVHPTDGHTVYALSREGVFHLSLPAGAQER